MDNLILCVSVELAAKDYPPTGGYVQQPCPLCSKAMWIGPKSLKVIQGGTRAICMIWALLEPEYSIPNLKSERFLDGSKE